MEVEHVLGSMVEWEILCVAELMGRLKGRLDWQLVGAYSGRQTSLTRGVKASWRSVPDKIEDHILVFVRFYSAIAR